MDKKKQSEWKRHRFQILWAFLTNSYLVGFAKGKIYDGKLKNLCVPGLNCYSCPGALGSCPIGAMQAVIGSWNFRMAFYVAGFLVFVGALMGRFVCGWLCPFGLIQDFLHKIPFVKKISTFRGDWLLRKLKYVIFLVFVILLPMFVVDMLGQGAPYFCKLICPAGTLEGGIPLVLLNSAMRTAVGWLYAWKNVLLVVIVLLSVVIYRPFCKYICPWARCIRCLIPLRFSATGWTKRRVFTAASVRKPAKCRWIRRKRPIIRNVSAVAPAKKSVPREQFIPE